jgi:hypothetical protein
VPMLGTFVRVRFQVEYKREQKGPPHNGDIRSRSISKKDPLIVKTE